MKKNLLDKDGYAAYKQVYICDICGLDINYEKDFDKYGSMPFPVAVGWTISQHGEINTHWAIYNHFHPDCFKEKIKPILLKKEKAHGGSTVGLVNKDGIKIREFDSSIYIKESQLKRRKSKFEKPCFGEWLGCRYGGSIVGKPTIECNISVECKEKEAEQG